MLGVEPGSSGRAAGAFNHKVIISPSPIWANLDLVEVLSFQVTLVCVKLTKTKEHPKGREESAVNSIRTRGVELLGGVLTAQEVGREREGPKNRSQSRPGRDILLDSLFPSWTNQGWKRLSDASLNISKRPGVLVEEFPVLWCGAESHKAPSV